MDGLSLDTLKFSTAEYSSYAQVFHEFIEFSHEERHGSIVCDRGDHIALSIPKVRGWLGAKFFTLSLGQIDQILQMTCPQDSSLIRMSRIQFFAALRIAVHAQAGAGVVMKSVFKQASEPSLLRISTSSRAQYNIASNPPSEILAQIFGYTLKVLGKYDYDPHSSLVSFLTVNKWWSGVAYGRLYRSISVGSCDATNRARMLRRTLSDDAEIAALVVELRLAQGSRLGDDGFRDYIAILDLCINLKHVDIFSREFHTLEGCRRALAQKNLISINIRTQNWVSLKVPAFCSTGCLLEMMQGWPDLEKLHISHVAPSGCTLPVIHNNCCPRLKDITIDEGKFTPELLPQLPRMTQAVERLHLQTAWVHEFPASVVFPVVRTWQDSLKWFHYAPKTRLDIHPSHHPHLPHLKYFETNSTALPASYLRIISPNVSTLRYMATIEDFHYITTNLYDSTFLSSLTLFYIYSLPCWSRPFPPPKLPEDDVRSLKKICMQRSIQLVFQLYPSPRIPSTT